MNLAKTDAGSSNSTAADASAPSASSSSGKVGIAAAVGINLSTSSAVASIPDGLSITAGGLLTVSASNDTDASAVGDGSQVGTASSGPKVGVGAGVAINDVTATNEATIGNGVQVTSQSVTLEASTTNAGGALDSASPPGTADGVNTFSASATSGAGASNVGVAGSLALNLVTNTNEAVIENSSTSSPATTLALGGGDLTLTAQDTSSQAATATANAVAGKVGIGASVAVNIATNTSDAEAQDGAQMTGVGNITIAASSTNSATTSTTAGGQSTSSVAIGGAVSIVVVTNTTTAQLGTLSGTQQLGGALQVTATHTGTNTTSADGTTVGGNVGIGAAIALNIASDTTTATTKRSLSAGGAVSFTVTASAANGADAKASAMGADPTQTSSSGGSGADGQVDDQMDLAKTDAGSGNSTASNASAPSASTSGGKVGIAAALGINLATSSAVASIPDGLSISAGGLLTVSSSNDTDALATADGSQVGTSSSTSPTGSAPKVGVGAGVAINLVTATNEATIGNGVQVTSQGLTLQALTTNAGGATDLASPPGTADGVNTFSASATSGAGAMNVGIAGSLALNLISNTNQAEIENTSTSSPATSVALGGGDLTLTAQNTSSQTATATTSASGGKVGVGAAVAVNTSTSTSDAEVQDGVQLSGANNATLMASSNQTITTTTTAGSSGNVAITPSVAVTVASDESTASLGAGNGVDLAGALQITATHTGTTTATAQGDTTVGSSAGIGVSLALNIVSDSATATLSRNVQAHGAASITTSTMANNLANGVASEGGTSSSDQSSDSNSQQQATFGESEPNAPTNNASVPSQSQALQENASPTDSSSNPSSESTSQGGSGEATVGIAAAIGINIGTSSSVASVADGVHLVASGPLSIISTSGAVAGASAVGTAVNPQQKNSIAAAVSLNVVSVTNHAIAGNNVTLSGSSISIVALQPTNSGAVQPDDFRTWSVSGAGGSNSAVAGSFGVNVINFGSNDATNFGTQASIGSNGTVSSTGDLTIESQNNLTIRNIAGSAAFGGQNAGVGVSAAVNVIRNQTTSFIGASTRANAADALTVEATASIGPSTGTLSWETQVLSNLKDASGLPLTSLPVGTNGLPIEPTAAAASGAVSGKISVGGSVALNVFFEKTTAYIDQSAQINQSGSANADQSVALMASDNLTIFDGAGGISGGGKAGIGLGLDVGVFFRDTEAYIASSALVSAQSSISLMAPTQVNVTSLAAEVGAGGNVGVSGSISVYVFPSTTDTAHIDDSATVAAGGDLTLSAMAGETFNLIAGSAGGGGSAGVGVSNTTLVKTDDVESSIGTSATISSHGSTGLSLTGFITENITTIAVAGAAGGSAGVAGSATVNVWNDTTRATIAHGATVDASGRNGTTPNVALLASDGTTLFSTAGALSGGGSAGVGAGVDVGVITKNTQAYIATASVNAGGNVSVQAESSENITSIVASIGVGGSVGVAGSVGVYVLSVTTRAFLGLDEEDSNAVPGSTSVTARGNILVAATESTKLLGLAGNISGGGSASIGAAAAVPIVTKTTEAFVGPGASVHAMGLVPSDTMTADDGLFAISYTPYTQSSGSVGTVAPGNESANLPDAGSSPLANPRLSNERVATPEITSMQGIAVTAVNQDDYEVIGGSGGASGSVAVNISGAVNVLTTHTSAFIAPGAKVNANNSGDGTNQSVLVAAGDDYAYLGIAAGISLAGAVGVSPDAGVLVVTNTTKAFIDDGAAVNALRDITVRARGEEDVLAITAAASGSGTVAVSGAVSVIVLNDTTYAYIGNNPSTNSNDPSGIVASANAGGNILIDASDDTKTYTIAGAIGVGIGVGGIGAGVAVTVVTKDTEAFVGQKSVVDAAGNSAALIGSIRDGGCSSSSSSSSDGEPEPGFSTLAGFHGLAVQAASSENVLSVSAAGGGGFYVGLGGGVSVELVSSTTKAYIDSQAIVNKSLVNPSAADSVNISAANSATVFGFGGGIGGGIAGIGGGIDVGFVQNNTSGYIGAGAEVHAPQDVSVTALSIKNVSSYAVSAAGGIAAIAGSVSVWTLGSSFSSGYSDSSGDSTNSLQSGNTGLGSTTSGADSETGSLQSELSGYSTGGSPSSNRVGTNVQNASGMISSTGTSSAVNGAMSTSAPSGTAAFIAAGATVSAGENQSGTGNVSVQAKENITFNVTVGGISVGVAGIGGSVAVVNIQSHLSAYIDHGATVKTGSAGNILVNATLTDNVTGNAYAGQAGIVALGAQVVVLNDTSTEAAYVGSGAHIPQTSSLTVEASANRILNANVVGGAIGGVAAGAAIAQGTAGGSTNAYLDTNVQVGQQSGESVGSITVSAASVDNVNTDAIAVAAGIGAGAVNDSQAAINPTVQASVGDGANLTTSGAISVMASETPASNAASKGIAVGAVGLGASFSTADNNATVLAFVGTNNLPQGVTPTGVRLAGSSLTISALQQPGSGPSAYAQAIAGAGGTLVGANATYAETSSNGTVQAYTGDSVLLPNGDVNIDATNQTMQSADATGVAVGYIGIGADIAVASSGVSTFAGLGNGVSTNAGRTGLVSVMAMGADDNVASSTAGSGGVFAGDASSATTTDNSTVQAGSGGGTINASNVMIMAFNTSTYAPNSDSTNAAAAGASGAFATNTDNTSANVTIGNGLNITADGTVTIAAQNQFLESTGGSSAGAGGLLNGTAAVSQSSIDASTPESASITVGNSVVINSGTDPNTNPGGITLVASSVMNTNDQVTLTTGGAIEGAGVNSSLSATLNNEVTIGSGGMFTSQGNIGVGTYTSVLAQTNSEVTTYGAAAVGVAEASTNVTTNQSVEVGASTMTAIGNVNLTAGNDPAGRFFTVISGTANAIGYVRGLIAIPAATASTDLVSNASLTIDAGAHINSGQNTTIGSFPGMPTAQADGTGHGYELGFIPATDGTSTPSTSTSSTVTENGSITAGIFHELTINIDVNGNVSTNPDGNRYTPYTYQTISSFNAPNYINANFTGLEAQVLDSNVSSTDVGALEFGALFAAGGTVTVNASHLVGSGSIDAYGGPTISVTNHSPDYLILGTITIPNQPGATVLFTGGATVAGTGITLNQTAGNGEPAITITNDYPNAVGTSATGAGPLLVVAGTIENLGGSLTITNDTGSFAQGAVIAVKQETVNVPNGAEVVQIPSPNPYHSSGDPYSQWQNFMLWPGGNPASVVPNSNSAVAWVANAEYNASGSFTDSQSFTQYLIGAAGDTPNTTDQNNFTFVPRSGDSYVYFGDDLPWVGSVPHDGTSGTAGSLSPIGQAYAISSDSSAQFNEGYFPVVPVEPLVQSSGATGYVYADLSGAQASANVVGGQIVIKADTIDIDGSITAGQPTIWSLELPATLDGALAFDKLIFDQGGAGPVFNIPLATLTPGDAQITATYNAQTNQITVQNLTASSGGGFVALEGNIISANTLGQINVRGGLGQVSVDNQTGIPLVVQNIYAGASTAAAVSQVDILDTLTQTQTLYVYQSGQNIAVHQGSVNETLADLRSSTPTYTVNGSSTTYAPDSGVRWQWQLTANLSRTIANNGQWVWNFPTSQPNNPWLFLDSSGNTTTTSVGQVITNSSLENTAFYETISGFSEAGYIQPVNYHDNHFGFSAPSGGGNVDPWVYYFADYASLTLTNSVKADNLIGINFFGTSTGDITITSNAPVIIEGQIVNPLGATSITAQGNITETAGASLESNSLSLQAIGGSSTVKTVPAGALQLSNNASGGTFTISVSINGKTQTTAPLAYNANGAVLQAALNSLAGVNVAVTGSGTQGDPWLISGLTATITVNDSGLVGGSIAVQSVLPQEQRLWNNATGGTFTITATVNGIAETTVPLSHSATAAQLQAALNALAGVKVTVTGSGTSANPWSILGSGVSTLSLNDSGLTYNSIVQTIPAGAQELWNNATSGTFTISAVVGGKTEITNPIDYNTTASAVQAALNALAGVSVTVTGSGTVGDPWIIVGHGFSALSVNDSSLTATDQPAPAGAQELWNNATGGTFTITATVNSKAETTAALAFNATGTQVEAALNALAGVTVLVTGSGTAADPWVISGTGYTALSTDDSKLTGGSSTLQNVPAGAQQLYTSGSGGAFTFQMTVGGQSVLTTLPAATTAAQLQAALDALGSSVHATITGLGTVADPWLISGTGVSTITPVPFGLTGGSSTLQAVPAGALELSNNAASGTFTISATVAGVAETTGSIPYNASAAVLKAALAALTPNAVTATVTGVGTPNDPWLITGSGLTTFTTDDSGLTGKSTLQSLPVEALSLSNNATGGTFTLSATVNGVAETTSNISYNASAAVLQAALGSLAGVQVLVTGSGTAADPWIIVGTGFTALKSNDSLSGGSSTLQVVPAGAQQVVDTATGGNFTIQMSINGVLRTTTLPYNATAAQLQAALNAMDPSVLATVSGLGTPGDPWLITGTGLSTIIPIVVGLTGGSSTLQAAPSGAQELWNTATGGSFTLTIDGSYTTAAIAYNATATQLKTALNATVPSLSFAVTGLGTAAAPWVISSSNLFTITTNDSGLSGGSIGSAAQPLAAVLGSGVLNATAGNQGVYLQLNSGGLIDQVTAGNALSGYGNVVITSLTDLDAVAPLPAGAVNVTGNDITLVSTTGGIGINSPMLITAFGSIVGGVSAGGIVSATAQGNINLTRNSGDLLIGSIASLDGDVTIDVPKGNILDASGQTAAQVLSQAQLTQIWQNLHLLDNTSANNTIATFDNLAGSNYQQYWQLLQNGTEVTGNPILMFAPASASSAYPNDPTLSRSAGTWTADGFRVGQTIMVTGSSQNKGLYTIDAISSDGATLYLKAAIQYETASTGGGSSVAAGLTGNPGLTFAPAPGGAASFPNDATLTRSAGSWTADGFQVGQIIHVSGAGQAGNNGSFAIDAISHDGTILYLVPGIHNETDAGGLQISVEAGVTSNPILTFAPSSGNSSPFPNDPTLTRSAGSWTADGFQAGQTINIAGATQAGNNGSFTIDGVSADGTILYLRAGVNVHIQSETESSGVAVTVTGGVAGSPSLTFTMPSANSAYPNDPTLTRSAGSWTADGILVGESIQIAGATQASNNGSFMIDAISADGTTLYLKLAIRSETESTGVTVTSEVDAVTISVKAGAAAMTGTPALVFAPANAGSAFPNDPTLTRSAGSWATDGFLAGQTIKISGATHANNNGLFMIDAVSADGTILYLTAGANVQIQSETESSGVAVIVETGVTGTPTVSFAPAVVNSPYPNDPTLMRSAGSWTADGFEAGQIIQIAGATRAGNNGSFIIDAVSPDGKTLYLKLAVQTETDSSGVGVVSGQLNGTFSLNATAVALYRPQVAAELAQTSPTDAQVQSYASQLYQNLVAFFNNKFVDASNTPIWMQQADFQAFDRNFQYAATPNQATNLTQNHTWTQDQLSHFVEDTALNPTTGTPVGIGTPNVSGLVVNLYDETNNIGQLGAPVSISYQDLFNGTLTDAQAAALAIAAAPGDVVEQGSLNGQTITFKFGQEPVGATLTGILVSVTEPLFVSVAGSLNAQVEGALYVQSTTEDLEIGQVIAGGAVNITAPRNIVSAGTESTQIKTSGDLTLLAGIGNLGTSASDPLVVEVGGQVELALAGRDLNLELVGGDLRLARAVAGQTAQLDVPDGNIVSENAGVVVRSQALDLEVAGGVGTANGRLVIQLGSGDLTGTVVHSVYIESAVALNVGHLVSTAGSIDLLIDSGDVNLGQLDAATSVTVANQTGNINNSNTDGTTDITAPAVTLNAVLGAIGSSAAPVTIDTSSSPTGVISAFGDQAVYLDEVHGDLRVGQISSPLGDVVLVADDSILDGGSGNQTNVFGVNVSLTATHGGIGTVAQDLNVDSSNSAQGVLNALANLGVYITQTIGSLNVGAVTSMTGDVRLTVPEEQDSAESLTTTSASSITAGGNVLLRVGNNVNLSAGSTIIAQGGNAVQPSGTVTVHGDFDNGSTLSPDVATTFNLFASLVGSTALIYGDDNNDVFNIGVVTAGTPMTVQGFGNDNSFDISSDAPTNTGALTGIQGKLTIVAGGGTDNRLVVGDRGDSIARNVTITSGRITGFAQGEIDYSSTTGNFSNADGGSGGILLITSATSPTTLNVQSTLAGSTTSIRGSGAADTINVSSDAAYSQGVLVNNGDLLGIGGTLLVDAGSSGTNRLVISNYGGAASPEVVLEAASYNGQSYQEISDFASAPIYFTATGGSYTDGAVNDGILMIGSNTGNNTFNVRATLAASTTALDGGGGTDTFNVSSDADSPSGVLQNSGNLGGILGALTIDGGSSTANRLVISNFGGPGSSDAVEHAATVNGQSFQEITGFAPAAIYYTANGGSFFDMAATSGVVVKGSSTGNDTFNIGSTLAGSTTIFLADGNAATFNVNGPAFNPNDPANELLGILVLQGNSSILDTYNVALAAPSTTFIKDGGNALHTATLTSPQPNATFTLLPDVLTGGDGTVVWDNNLQQVTLAGINLASTQRNSDTVLVAPSPDTAIVIDAPASANSNREPKVIEINLAGLPPSILHVDGPGAGTLMTPGYQNLSFANFDQVTAIGATLDVLLDGNSNPASGVEAGDGTLKRYTAKMDGTLLELDFNGVPVFLGNPTAIGTITVQGSTDNDILTVDNSHGLFNGQIDFNGGTSGDHSLVVNGGTTLKYTPSATTPGSGTVLTTQGSQSQTINFQELTPMYFFNQASAIIALPNNGADIIVDSPALSSLPALDQTAITNAGLATGQFSRIAGTVKGVAIEPVYFGNVPQVTLDGGQNSVFDPNSSNDDSITIDATGVTAAELKNFTILGAGVGNNTLTDDSSIYSLPATGGGISFVGGTKANTIVADAAVNYVLNNAGLTSSAGGTIQFVGVNVANLIGTGSTFDVSGWSNTGSLTDTTGGTVVDVGPADFTLSDTQLQRDDINGHVLSLNNINRADLTDTAGGHNFTLNNWSGTSSLTNGSGTVPGTNVTSDTLIAANAANYVLTNSELSINGAVNSLNGSIPTANLTDTGSGHIFIVSGWTGTGSLSGAGTETVAATKDANFTLGNTGLSSSDGMSLTLTGFTIANLGGGPSANTFTVSGWTGSGRLSGGAIAGTLVAIKDTDFLLANNSLATGDGMSLTLADIGTANLTGGPGLNTFDVSGWTGDGILTGGGNTDDVDADKSANFTLSNTNLTASDGLNMALNGIDTANLTQTASNDTFTVSGWTGGGRLSGLGSASVNATKNANFTLANSLLQASDGLNLALTGIRIANLGVTGADTFTMSGWNGAGKLTGNGTATIDVTKDANIALTNSSLTASDALSLTLAGIGATNIVVGPSADTVTLDGWTTNGSVTGTANDTVSASKLASFALTNSLLSSSDGMNVSLSGIRLVHLVSTASVSTFNVSGWTCGGSISGGPSATVTATKDADFSLSNTTLQTSDGMNLSLVAISGAKLTGGPAGNQFAVNHWSGTDVLDGNGGNNTFTVNLSGAGATVLQDSNSNGSDHAVVNDLAGNDAVSIVQTQLTRGSETVQYSSAIVGLTFNDGTGVHTFNATSSPGTAITVNGGGQDTLNFDATGLNETIGVNTITAPGRQPFTFNGIAHLNVTPATLYVQADSFVRRLYPAVLGRAPDAGGLQSWVSDIVGGASFATVAQAILASPEHRTIQIDSYYQTFLGRQPDPMGLAYWLSRFAAGATEEGVELGILEAPEFMSAHASNSSFLNALYQELLNRAPDAVGFASLSASLQSGVARSAVISAFLTSDEYRLDVIDAYYAQLLHRAADTGGAQHWLGVYDSGTPQDAIAVDLVTSPEFLNES